MVGLTILTSFKESTYIWVFCNPAEIKAARICGNVVLKVLELSFAKLGRGLTWCCMKTLDDLAVHGKAICYTSFQLVACFLFSDSRLVN